MSKSVKRVFQVKVISVAESTTAVKPVTAVIGADYTRTTPEFTFEINPVPSILTADTLALISCPIEYPKCVVKLL